MATGMALASLLRIDVCFRQAMWIILFLPVEKSLSYDRVKFCLRFGDENACL